MKLIVTKQPDRRWLAVVYDDADVLCSSLPEQRLGCAVRSALNTLQRMYPPTLAELVIDLEEW